MACTSLASAGRAAAPAATVLQAAERPPCQAVVTDVDGTLFPFGTSRRLSEVNRAALLGVLDAGLPLCLATGRIPGPWSEALREELPGLGPSVFANGALVIGPEGEVLFEATLPPEAVQAVEAFFRGGSPREQEGRCVSLLAATRWPDEESGSEVYLELAPDGPTWVSALIDRAGEPPVVLRDDFRCVLERKIHKFVVFTDPKQEGWAQMPPIIEALRQELVGTGATVLDCGPKQCEIFAPGVNKGEGVRALLKVLGGIPAESLLACGDAENDVEMLQLAGVGAAMGNAKAVAKDAADVVVATNDRDGVAEAVLRYVLKESV